MAVNHFFFLIISLYGFSSVSNYYYADNGLDDGQTIAYKHLKKWERDEMQMEILHVLGLHHRPKPGRRDLEKEQSAPRYLKDVYSSLLDSESGHLRKKVEDEPAIVEGEVLSHLSLIAINNSDTIMSFTNQVDKGMKILQRHRKDRQIWFDISEVPASENVMEAEVRLYRDISSSILPLNYSYIISIYSVAFGDHVDEKVLKLVDEKEITSESGWIMFNVTGTMINWIAFADENLGLYIRITSTQLGREIEPREIGLCDSLSTANRQPFMIAFLQAPKNVHSRSPRTAKNGRKKKRKNRKKNKGQSSRLSSYKYDQGWNPYLNEEDRRGSSRSCRKKTLYVSFKDLGWQDWIIAPDGYASFFCHGECSFPLQAHMNATNHAIVQTLVHLMNPNIVPKPCCAPTKLSAIMVLYFDDNSNVILKKYKNMVVKACGCH